MTSEVGKIPEFRKNLMPVYMNLLTTQIQNKVIRLLLLGTFLLKIIVREKNTL